MSENKINIWEIFYYAYKQFKESSIKENLKNLFSINHYHEHFTLHYPKTKLIKAIKNELPFIFFQKKIIVVEGPSGIGKSHACNYVSTLKTPNHLVIKYRKASSIKELNIDLLVKNNFENIDLYNKWIDSRFPVLVIDNYTSSDFEEIKKFFEYLNDHKILIIVNLQNNVLEANCVKQLKRNYNKKVIKFISYTNKFLLSKKQFIQIIQFYSDVKVKHFKFNNVEMRIPYYARLFAAMLNSNVPYYEINKIISTKKDIEDINKDLIDLLIKNISSESLLVLKIFCVFFNGEKISFDEMLSVFNSNDQSLLTNLNKSIEELVNKKILSKETSNSNNIYYYIHDIYIKPVRSHILEQWGNDKNELPCFINIIKLLTENAEAGTSGIYKNKLKQKSICLSTYEFFENNPNICKEFKSYFSSFCNNLVYLLIKLEFDLGKTITACNIQLSAIEFFGNLTNLHQAFEKCNFKNSCNNNLACFWNSAIYGNMLAKAYCKQMIYKQQELLNLFKLSLSILNVSIEKATELFESKCNEISKQGKIRLSISYYTKTLIFYKHALLSNQYIHFNEAISSINENLKYEDDGSWDYNISLCLKLFTTALSCKFFNNNNNNNDLESQALKLKNNITGFQTTHVVDLFRLIELKLMLVEIFKITKNYYIACNLLYETCNLASFTNTTDNSELLYRAICNVSKFLLLTNLETMLLSNSITQNEMVQHLTTGLKLQRPSTLESSEQILSFVNQVKTKLIDNNTYIAKLYFEQISIFNETAPTEEFLYLIITN